MVDNSGIVPMNRFDAEEKKRHDQQKKRFNNGSIKLSKELLKVTLIYNSLGKSNNDWAGFEWKPPKSVLGLIYQQITLFK